MQLAAGTSLMTTVVPSTGAPMAETALGEIATPRLAVSLDRGHGNHGHAGRPIPAGEK